MSFSFFDWLPAIHLGTWRPDTINGSDRRDIIISFGSDDVINAKGGDDIVISGSGKDFIDAGSGDDLVEAGSGDDTVRGGRGSDTIHGGSGFDTAVYERSIDDYDIKLPRFGGPISVKEIGTRDTDRLTSVEALYFEADDFTLYVDGRNNAVLARDDAFSTDENTALELSSAQLTANDRDFDGDTLTITAVSATSALGAAVALSDGVVTYDQGDLFQSLKAGETVEDTFTYTVDDGRGGASTATVTITITGVNDDPTISSVANASVEENFDGTVLTVAADDVDSDTLTFAIAGGADAALFEIDSATGALRFISPPDFELPADQGGDNVYDLTVSVADGDGGAATQDIAITVTDVIETPPVTPRINEIHYDNAGTDAGEFVEIRVGKDADVSSLRIDLYNGSGGAAYGGTLVSALTKTSDADYDYYVWTLPANGIQNGSPDGVALSDVNGVIEFLSYEGAFTASGGAANGLTSTDILVAEGGSDPAGLSLQRTGDGPTEWAAPATQTPGASNDGGGPAITARINEIHYDNAGGDIGEFVEIRVNKDADVSGFLIELYNLTGGATYASTSVAGLTKTSDADYDYYVWDRPADGIQNGPQDGVALSNNGSVIEFVSYEGTLTASNGTAAGLTSTDIGVAETTSTPVGQSLQRTGDGLTDWEGPIAETRGEANDGGGNPGDPTPLLISQVQGTGSASMVVGSYVLVSAVVTYTVGNGFFLQEEAADSDGNAASSEGIFVFTGGAPAVAVGDLVEVAGTVVEFNTTTEITDIVSVNKIGTASLPDYASITLPNASASALEQFEGMRVSLTSGTDDPITITENFNFGRFGEIAVSAGNKYQPTQLFDPDTQAVQIATLQQANEQNRLIIDDGVSAQNPTEFRYVPVSTGDNGNGYLDAGDDFTATGPTLRLGAELNAPVEGVLHYDFGDYRMFVDGQISIDEATNSGARGQSPEDVGGSLKVASFNVLNYFTTLRVEPIPGGPPPPGSGPNNLEPRGATTPEDFQRQTDKIVAAMLEIDADVFGLQELENGGFGEGSAIQALVDALNEALGSEVYAFVDPTDDAGFIGTDAITTGLIYKIDAVSVVGSDFFTFNDAPSAQQQNRPAVAATFEEIGTGERFTVAVNHFKSKSGNGTGDDMDIGDGQGAFNGTRTRAAEQLTDWLENGYAHSNGDPDVLLLGDLNAYAQEDPVDVIRDAGYIDLIDQFIGQNTAYSFVFDGQRGSLDQGLATSSLASQVTGLTEWHINSDEPGLFGYSSEFTDPRFYDENPFAASDHDPLIIGLNLGVDDVAFV